MTRDRVVRTVSAVGAIAREWNADELIEHMDSKTLAATQKANFRDLAAMCSGELGLPKNQKTLMRSAGVDVGTAGL